MNTQFAEALWTKDRSMADGVHAVSRVARLEPLSEGLSGQAQGGSVYWNTFDSPCSLASLTLSSIHFWKSAALSTVTNPRMRK